MKRTANPDVAQAIKQVGPSGREIATHAGHLRQIIEKLQQPLEVIANHASDTNMTAHLVYALEAPVRLIKDVQRAYTTGLLLEAAGRFADAMGPEWNDAVTAVLKTLHD